MNKKIKNKIMTEKVKEIKDLINNQLRKPNNLGDNAVNWVKGIGEMLQSKTYVASNVKDILWFYENGLLKCKKILDFGCGSGYISYLISLIVDKVIGCEYLGEWVDQNYRSQDYFKAFSFCHKIIKRTRSNLDFDYYKKLPLNITAGFFDGVVLYAVIEHIDEKILRKTLLELNRLLKKNGYLFIAKLPRYYSYQEKIMEFLKLSCHSNLFTIKKIKNLMEKCNFKIIKIEKTGLFFNHSNVIINLFFPLTNFLEDFIEKYFKLGLFIAHDYRIIAVKK